MRKTTTLEFEKKSDTHNLLTPSSQTIAAILAFSATYHVERLENGTTVEMLLN